jgi:hypothetical protein
MLLEGVGVWNLGQKLGFMSDDAWICIG